MKQLSIAALFALGLGAPALAADPSLGWAEPISDALWEKMQGVSWHADLNCPARADLVVLNLPFRNYSGLPELGQLVVARELEIELLAIFGTLFREGFQIQSMRPVSEFEGNDRKSMTANNTSAFNCRRVAGTSRMSNHAFGRAIDINPVQNPFVTASRTSPANGVDFDDAGERTPGVRGIITEGSVVVQVFDAFGWDWGGRWNSLKDYQHFSKDGG